MDYKYEIMKAVKRGDIEQTKRWYFVSRRLMFWLSVASSVVVGVIAFSLILDTILLSVSVHDSFSFLVPIQLFWIVILMAATIFGWRVAKTSTELYKWRHSTIILTSILISIIGGYVLSLTSMNNLVTQAMYKRSAYYQALYVNLLQETSPKGPATYQELLEVEHIRTLCFKKSEKGCYFRLEKAQTASEI